MASDAHRISPSPLRPVLRVRPSRGVDRAPVSPTRTPDGRGIDGDQHLRATTSRPARARRWVAFLAAAAVTAAGLASVSPATAADPWIIVQDDGYLRIAVPNAGVEEAVGPVSQVVVEGNFGPSANWAQIGLQRNGANWTATYGPFEPGLYYYQVTGDDSKVLKDTTNPKSVASEPEWSTFFIAGESAALLADAPEAAGAIETLTYTSGVAGEERSALVWTPPTYKDWRTVPRAVSPARRSPELPRLGRGRTRRADPRQPLAIGAAAGHGRRDGQRQCAGLLHGAVREPHASRRRGYNVSSRRRIERLPGSPWAAGRPSRSSASTRESSPTSELSVPADSASWT